MNTGFPGVPVFLTSDVEHRRQIAEAINTRLNRGKFNCTVSFTLTASVTSTTLTDERIGASSYIGFMPTTAHAAAVSGSIYVTAQKKGSCTVNHTSDANVDKTFTVLILG